MLLCATIFNKQYRSWTITAVGKIYLITLSLSSLGNYDNVIHNKLFIVSDNAVTTINQHQIQVCLYAELAITAFCTLIVQFILLQFHCGST